MDWTNVFFHFHNNYSGLKIYYFFKQLKLFESLAKYQNVHKQMRKRKFKWAYFKVILF